MIIDLVNTTTRKIEDALAAARRRIGGPASSKVLTLVVVTDEAGQYDALRASTEAARDHPSRTLGVITRDRREETRLDAEVHIGDAGPGEIVLMRLYGELVQHAEAAVLPLLVPDTPVVTWWPGEVPRQPSAEPLGSLAQRRVTDAAGGANPLSTLTQLADAYRPGDTDLSWTRITLWRSLLAATLDEPHEAVTGAVIESEPDSPSAALLASWLAARLNVTSELSFTHGPGISVVRLKMPSGSIVVTRRDGRMATLSRPGHPDRRLALHRRPNAELIAEELRRLEPDDVYREAVRGWPRNVTVRTPASVS
jgi:glucose-6-phosphate dehydrogenase assembly protein OpcA